MGFIAYDSSQATIALDWRRICLYSTLDSAMTSKSRINQFIQPVDFCQAHLLRQPKLKHLMKKYKTLKPYAEVSPSLQRFYQALGEMTEYEAIEMINMGKLNTAPSGAYITI